METVGFIGLGIMGFPMSQRLLDAGYPLVVHDINPEPVAALETRGASKGHSARDVAARADILISMLPFPAVTREVMLGTEGAVQGLRPGATYIDMSTSSPSLTREIWRTVMDKGAHMVDAPVSGGIRGAREGTLAIMVGGARDTFERVSPLLALMGKKVMHVGQIGSGHTVKVVNNLLYSVTMAATAEALALGRKAGVDPVILREAMNSGSGRSYSLDVKVRDFIFPRDFEPGFTVELLNKDTDLALELARELGVPVLLGNLVRQLYQTLEGKGYRKKDNSIIVTLFEELMGSGQLKADALA